MDIYQREFLALRDRLHTAEQESLKRSKELNLVLEEIKRAVSERQALREGEGNRTWGRLTEDPRLKPWNVSHRHVLHLPTVFHHLPHLLAKESSLQPAVRVGQGRTGGMGVAREGREAGREAVPGALSSVTPPRPCSFRGDGRSKRAPRGALLPD